MRTENTAARKIWYREPWVWLLIALPATAVIGSMITIYLAVTSSDGLVVDDYYKRGKAINMELARDEAASFHRLRAMLAIDPQTGRVGVSLESRDDLHPPYVRLLLLHPTRAGHDQRIRLLPDGQGGYTGAVQPVTPGNWHVQLETDEWRLSGRMELPREEHFRLVSQDMAETGHPESR